LEQAISLLIPNPYSLTLMAAATWSMASTLRYLIGERSLFAKFEYAARIGIERFRGKSMSNVESILADAAQLSVDERIELAEALWNTLPEASIPPISVEWLAEIEKRSAEYDAGLTTAVPWEDIRADALRRLADKAK